MQIFATFLSSQLSLPTPQKLLIRIVGYAQTKSHADQGSYGGKGVLLLLLRGVLAVERRGTILPPTHSSLPLPYHVCDY